MILIDMSNISFSVVTDYYRKTKEDIDIDLMRHLILYKLFKEKDKVKKFADEVVICMDGCNTWRKKIFPYYKASRKTNRDNDTMDWDKFFKNYNVLQEEFEENIPFKWIKVDHAEADDIISVISQRFGNEKDVCIVSSDKDFIQLQEFVPKVHQWSIYHNKMINLKNQNYDLFTHIVKGDGGDGIPNILSDDDTFVNPFKRQRVITAKKLEKWKEYGLNQPEKFCIDSITFDRFNRNKSLIDLKKIPNDIQLNIVDKFDSLEIKRGKIYNYLVKYKLNRIMKEVNI